jgi:hypothetical protein
MRCGWTCFRGFAAAMGLALVMASFTSPAHGQDDQQGAANDVQIWRMIIRDSIASYRHLCPCPYSPNRAGRACGTRSAYSRVDGSVICYVTDIPEAEVVRYRARLQGPFGSQQNQQ